MKKLWGNHFGGINVKRDINLKTINLEKDISNKEDYYTTKDLLNMGFKNSFIKRIKEYVQFYKYKQRLYILKTDFEKLESWKNQMGKINDLAIKFNCSKKYIFDLLKVNNIKFLTRHEQPFYTFSVYYLCDYEKIEKIILKGNSSDILDENKYVTLKEAANILNIDEIRTERVVAFDFRKKYKKEMYLKRDEVEYYKNIKETYISLTKFIKDICMELEIMEDTVRGQVDKIIKRDGINLISKHPFKGSINLISKKDAENIDKELTLDKNISLSKNGLEIYKFLIQDMDIPNELKNTMKLYDQFVISRLNVIKARKGFMKYAKSFFKIRNLLTKHLKIEIYKYSNNILEKMLEYIVRQEGVYTQIEKIEIVGFYNYLINNKILENCSKYKLSKSSFAPNNEVLAYTQEQFIELFRLLHTKLQTKQYLHKLIKNRGFAQIWIYMYLHYIVIWRRSDIQNLLSPNLNNIGFSGKEFLEYLEENNEFTDEMAMKIVIDVKKKIDTYGIVSTKNNRNLVIEIGTFTIKNLGLLLAMCEAHREISYNRNPNLNTSKYMISSGYIGNQQYYDDLFGQDLKNILGDELFSNRRLNKSYNNYIQNYSEENNDFCANEIFAIMRGHSVDKNKISETAKIYETRKVDNTINNAITTLINRGSFAFEKFQVLKMIDSNFSDKDNKEKDMLLNDLDLTPYELEYTIKNIYKQREKVITMISKMMINSENINQIILELANGNTYSKYGNSRCLLKAILNSMTPESEIKYDIFKLEQGSNCIMKDFDGCIGCPFFIEEMFFLYELNDLIFENILNLERCKSSYDKYMYTQLLFKNYIPILKESQKVLGKNIVNSIVDITEIKQKIYKLRDTNLILLHYYEKGEEDND